MFSSSIFILSFLGVMNFSLSAANAERHKIEHLNTEKTPYGSTVTVVNIGNGEGKVNDVTLDERQNNYPNTRSRSKYNAQNKLDVLPTPTTKPQTTPKQEHHWHSSYNNIGNGAGNTNVLVTENGGHKVTLAQNANAEGYSGGTSFVVNRQDGVDHFNVGYGLNNQNNIVYSNIPTQPDNTGSKPSDEFTEQLLTLKQIADELQGIVTKLIQEQHSCIPQE
ncbi:uncharacterized protein LOC112055588 [Bicyclus anynana]|uniref:Uncharacterized protein LOC112055588 n=1 Tax=Bicyclus anynana TaxID=110368 RepID=A0A6J1P289_BICAN|nr:uncharacterized protein LOC112055588 [Bicyclus anynana]